MILKFLSACIGRGKTLDSHRLIRLAGQQGPEKQNALVDELFANYFTQEKYIGDRLDFETQLTHSTCIWKSVGQHVEQILLAGSTVNYAVRKSHSYVRDSEFETFVK